MLTLPCQLSDIKFWVKPFRAVFPTLSLRSPYEEMRKVHMMTTEGVVSSQISGGLEVLLGVLHWSSGPYMLPTDHFKQLNRLSRVPSATYRRRLLPLRMCRGCDAHRRHQSCSRYADALLLVTLQTDVSLSHSPAPQLICSESDRDVE